MLRASCADPRRSPTSLGSALPHLDVFHILFNVYRLWAFGTLIEEVRGHYEALGRKAEADEAYARMKGRQMNLP
jgi:hypothetical protein